MQYQRRNTIYICCQQQKYPVSLMGICVLYRRDPLTQSCAMPSVSESGTARWCGGMRSSIFYP
jgi:hypothetical protein